MADDERIGGRGCGNLGRWRCRFLLVEQIAQHVNADGKS